MKAAEEKIKNVDKRLDKLRQAHVFQEKVQMILIILAILLIVTLITFKIVDNNKKAQSCYSGHAQCHNAKL